jgi:hypothetical protein
VEELYDLKADPHEIRNLAKDSDHSARLKSMRALVDNWVKDTGDQGFIMEDPVPIYDSYFAPKP